MAKDLGRPSRVFRLCRQAADSDDVAIQKQYIAIDGTRAPVHATCFQPFA